MEIVKFKLKYIFRKNGDTQVGIVI